PHLRYFPTRRSSDLSAGADGFPGRKKRLGRNKSFKIAGVELMRILIKCVACSFLLLLISSPLRAQATAPPQSEPAPSVQEILDRMMTRNAWQDRTLLEFRASRKFYAA